MGEIVSLRTPTGGTSGIVVNVTPAGSVEIKFTRRLGNDEVRQETICLLTRDNARRLGAALLNAAGDN